MLEKAILLTLVSGLCLLWLNNLTEIMRFDEFTQLMEKQERCPESLPKALQALWYDKKGDWDKAHQITQNASDTDSAWVHAYLHRKEGDLSNARYWYKRTGRLDFKEDLHQEWEQITRDLLGKI